LLDGLSRITDIVYVGLFGIPIGIANVQTGGLHSQRNGR
jgi:hypothetical protein